jgi:hypothetical protein
MSPDEGRESHAGIRRQFDRLRFGLLDEQAVQEIRAHLRDCAECRLAFDEFATPTEEEQERFGHVPDHVLAAWEREAPLLPVALRDELEAHLSACAECRGSLEFVRANAHPTLRVRRSWVVPVLGGYSAGITALAATLLVLVLGRHGPSTRPTGTQAPRDTMTGEQHLPNPSPKPSAGEGPASGGLAVGPAPRVIDLSGAARSAGGVPESSAFTPSVILELPPLLGVPPQARITVQIFDATGKKLLEHVMKQSDLLASGQGRLELRAVGGTLAAGTYVVRVTSDTPNPLLPGEFESAEYRFRLR